MIAVARTFSLVGVDAEPVYVETDVRRGLPGFTIVGLPDTSVREARERVRAALVVLQFAVSIGLIICTAVIYGQTVYARHVDPGYKRDHILQMEELGRAQLWSRVEGYVEQVKRVPGVVDAGLTDIGFDVHVPEGTYFMLAGYSRFSDDDDRAFAMRLVKETGVAVIPPSVFYNDPVDGRGLVRFAFCKRMPVLEEALSRLSSLAN